MYEKYLMSASSVDSWKKIQKKKKKLKAYYWKIYTSITSKHFSAIFILNHINNIIEIIYAVFLKSSEINYFNH